MQGPEPRAGHQPWPSSTMPRSGDDGGFNALAEAMVARRWSAGDAPASTSSLFAGRGGQLGRRPRGPRPPVPSPLPSLGLGRRAQQAAPGHRRSYKLFGRGYKRTNPCSHRTGFVPSPEPSLTINRGWVSSKVCSICCLLLENRSPFRMRESAGKAGICVNILMIILKE